MSGLDVRHRCIYCGKLTYFWQRYNMGYYECYDNCRSTTGIDRKTGEVVKEKQK